MRLTSRTAFVAISLLWSRTVEANSALDAYFAAHPISTRTAVSANSQQTPITNATLDSTVAAISKRPFITGHTSARKRVSILGAETSCPLPSAILSQRLIFYYYSVQQAAVILDSPPLTGQHIMMSVDLPSATRLCFLIFLFTIPSMIQLHMQPYMLVVRSLGATTRLSVVMKTHVPLPKI